MRYLVIIIGAVLVNNFVLSRFLGCCPFLGVSKKTETALGMSGAVVFVMTVAAAVTWLLDHYLLRPLGLDYIHTLVFILVIAALVQFIDIAMKRFLPPLHSALGIFLLVSSNTLHFLRCNERILYILLLQPHQNYIRDSILRDRIFQ